KTAITGWVIFLSGSAIWLYGYFIAGHPSIIDWHARTPWWIADFLPNLESELGMLLCISGKVPDQRFCCYGSVTAGHNSHFDCSLSHFAPTQRRIQSQMR